MKSERATDKLRDRQTKEKTTVGPCGIPFVQDYDPEPKKKGVTYPGQIPGTITGQGADPYGGLKNRTEDIPGEKKKG